MPSDKLLETIRELHRVRCPNCNEVFDNEFLGEAGLITYWAEDGAKEIKCPNCGTLLSVTESVDRTYDVKRVKQPEVTDAE